MSDGGWSDADWDDDDWEESRAEVDAALCHGNSRPPSYTIAPPCIEAEAAGAERLRRLEALKAQSAGPDGHGCAHSDLCHHLAHVAVLLPFCCTA